MQLQSAVNLIEISDSFCSLPDASEDNACLSARLNEKTDDFMCNEVHQSVWIGSLPSCYVRETNGGLWRQHVAGIPTRALGGSTAVTHRCCPKGISDPGKLSVCSQSTTSFSPTPALGTEGPSTAQHRDTQNELPKHRAVFGYMSSWGRHCSASFIQQPGCKERHPVTISI